MISLALCFAISVLACSGKRASEGTVQNTQAGMSWQDQYDLGVRLLNEGNYEDAILAFQAALSIDPKNVDARIGLAHVYQQMGDVDRLLQILADADHQDSRVADGYLLLAEKYFQEGKEEQAVRVLQQALNRLDGEDRDKVLDYVEKKGYVLDENGKLIKFDEEAYLATLSKDEIWRYYFSKGENADHWMFGDTILLNGRDVETITLETFETIAAENGWEYSELRYETYSDNGGSSTVYAWSYETEPYEIVFKASQSNAFLAQGYHCFESFDLGHEAAVAEADPVGVLDIRLGDSVETVLTKLGWLYADEIGAILRQPQGTAIDEETFFGSEDMEQACRNVISPLYDSLAVGEKTSEWMNLSYRMIGDGMALDLGIWLYEKSDEGDSDSSYQKIGFQFDGTDFALVGMDLHIG